MKKGFTIAHELPTWRKLALSTWRRGDDPTIYGLEEIDATALLAYVKQAREVSGARVTVTHVIGKAAAMAFAREPDCNGVVSWGRLKLRATVDVFFQVALDNGQNLSGAKISQADTLSVTEIAQKLDRGAKRIREKRDTDLQRSQSVLERVPSFFRSAAMRAAETAMYDMGLDLSGMGVPFDPFGTVMITNVGVFGIETGLAPLMPVSRTPALLCIGAIRDRVIVVDGAPSVRPCVTIGGTFDHRIIDGYHAGRLATHVREIVADPFKHLPITAASPSSQSTSDRHP
jgi:pyruvate dehydrogenase E2 component (dihydrolipoamide acetyltransferase)